MQKIQKDFDRIASLSKREKDCGGNYDRFLLRFVPTTCRRALEVGCGTGAFSRLLAEQVNYVTAIDLSGEMVNLARQRSQTYSNIDYKVGDILRMDLAPEGFDFIVMIATLHHLPLDEVIEKMKHALAPDGVLVIHDIRRSNGILDRSLDLLRLPTNLLVRWSRTGRLRARRELQRAWAEHGKGERYLSGREVRAMRDHCLPAAYVRQHFLWRYSVVWRKRDAA